MTQISASAQQAPAPTADAVIQCVGLTKIFRDFWLRSRVRAVDGISLEVQSGEVFGLLGPNGSGKSTTIKMILGLLHPTSGRIAVLGKHPRDVAIKRQIGYLPEETYLYRFLNAEETLDYYGRLFHQDRRQRRRRAQMLLEMVGLDRVAHRPVGEYSKGMQRRIGLAQALINDPHLLILDEPTTGLDPIGTRQIKDLILELARRGKTILLCSHLLADVEDVCDRVAIMFGGRIRRQGTVEQLLVQEELTTIQTPHLDADDITALEQTLQQRGKHIERVERPRQKLEALFLQIVEEAQAQGVQTSGAMAGGRIADFLTAEAAHLPESVQADQIIDRLMQPEEPAPASGDAAATDEPARDRESAVAPLQTPTPKAKQPAEPAQQVIDSLLAQDAAETPTTQQADRPPQRTQEEQVDRSVIDSLIRPDGQGGQPSSRQDA